MKSVLQKIGNFKQARILIEEKNCCFEKSAVINFRNCSFEGNNRIAQNAIVNNCNIGRASYIGNGSNIQHAVIGKYCSIGPNVSVIAGAHPTRIFVSTFPAFFSTRRQAGFSYVKEDKFQEFKWIDKEKHLVEIENDVWIGAGVLIMQGIHLRTGAIVAAGAVVTKDVMPYSIVAGVPAKVIGWRFDETTRERLLETAWWDRDEEWIKNHIDLFPDVTVFLNEIEGNNT